MKKIILICVLALVLLVVGCVTNKQTSKVIGTQGEAEKTAERFARYWEQENWENMYDLFIPELTELRNKEDFFYFMDVWEKMDPIVIRLDKVLMDSENLAYAYYTISSSIYDAKAPAMKVVFNNSWRIDALGSAFIEECAEKPCVSTDMCDSVKCNKSTKFKCIQFPKENCCKFSDSDCPEDKPYCNDFECTEKECFMDWDCSRRCETSDCSESVCDLDTNTCVECINNSNCEVLYQYFSSVTSEYKSWKPLCNLKNHSCASCLRDSDCTGTYGFCDRDSGRCVKCLTDSDCNGLLCGGGTCVECVNDSDCTTTDKPYCNHNGWGHDWPGKCSVCLNNTHCPKGQDCIITSYQKKIWGCRDD